MWHSSAVIHAMRAKAMTTPTNREQATSVSADSLRYARERAGFSLRDAARRAGVSHSALSAYERGLRAPSLDKLFDILHALGFAVRIELEPRVRERNGVPRGEELVEVIRLAEHYPPRQRPPISLAAILREGAANKARAARATRERAAKQGANKDS